MNIDPQTSRVLLIEPAASVRLMITDIFREFGFKNLTAVAKGKEALHILEVEKLNWIISPSLTREEVNVIHLLMTIIGDNSLREVKCSLMVEPEQEKAIISLAFENGLLSWHPKAYIREQVREEFTTFFQRLKANKYNTVKTSAEYLRKFLDLERLHAHRLAFEQNLTDIFPGSEHCLVDLAESYFLNQMIDAGIVTLRQAELINPKIKPLCDNMRRKFNVLDRQTGKATSANCLGIKSVVLIDSDTDVLHNLKEQLQKMGITRIDCFENALEAWSVLETTEEPGLIIMEWRLYGISGPLMVQRIRQHGFLTVPIIISSLVESHDEPILREMGIDKIQQKPFEANDFNKTLIWAIQQNRKPNEQKSYEIKIDRLLNANRIDEGQQLIAQYLADQPISDADKLAIQAEFKFAKGDFHQCQQLCLHSLRLKSDSLRMLNLLGKVLLKNGQSEDALSCFEQAQKISPMNISRLMQVADINYTLGNFEKFAESVNIAQDLDPDNHLVKPGICKLAIESGELERAKELIAELDSVSHMLRDMNNRAVALARMGHYEKGIDLYIQTIQALPVKMKAIQGAVKYNLALAYAKYGEHDHSREILDQINAKDLQGTLPQKISSLKSKLEKMRRGGDSQLNLIIFHDHTSEIPHRINPEIQGEDLNISSQEHLVIYKDICSLSKKQSEKQDPDLLKDAQIQTEQWLRELRNTIEIQRGDACCYLLYFDITGFHDSVLNMKEQIPRFSRRLPISKVV